MSNGKKLQDLTIRDNFMFVAVMTQEENCKRLLEMVLNIEIERIEVSYEKSFIYNPEYKGVRLDVYAKDENNTRYDVEMQVVKEHLGKRVRYYHSQMDMDLLLSGHTYEELPQTYVIFICNFDPFGEKKYCYTFENRCLEKPDLTMGDETKSIFLNAQGEDEGSVPGEMEAFLKFIREDTPATDTSSEDKFVRQLQGSIRSIKRSREMGQRYMLIEDLIRYEAKKEAKKVEAIAEARGEARGEAIGEARGELKAKRQSVLELLEDLGTVSDRLHTRIMSEEDYDMLKAMLKCASKATTLEQFEELISNL